MRALLFAGLMLAVSSAYAGCRASTAALDGMARAELTLKGPVGRSVRLAVRMADDDRERAGGFQYVCPATIASTSIYFVFDHPLDPTFHMHHVQAPLDIAFIDAGGVIVDIQRMEPYARGATRYRYYSPRAVVAAALETHAGYFTAEHISAGDWKVEASQ